jgi:hypothetical protein
MSAGWIRTALGPPYSTFWPVQASKALVGPYGSKSHPQRMHSKRALLANGREHIACLPVCLSAYRVVSDQPPLIEILPRSLVESWARACCGVRFWLCLCCACACLFFCCLAHDVVHHGGEMGKFRTEGIFFQCGEGAGTCSWDKRG